MLARRGSTLRSSLASASVPHATDLASEQLRYFIAALGLRAEQQRTLWQLLEQNEIVDVDTMRMIDEREWSAMGVKIGTRKKVIAHLAEAQ